MNLQGINKKDIESLTSDLKYAWTTRNDIFNENDEIVKEKQAFKRLLNASNYINSIDPENMDILRKINSLNKELSILEIAGNLI